MNDKSQLMRGTIEGCILQIINIKTTYGYEIIEQLQQYGFKEIKEGTIYPLLLRLEKKNLINSEFRPSPLGPSRKYYSLTKDGILTLKEFCKNWNEISQSVNTILSMGGINNVK
ncbi:PadR family transcriptional regulator [Clostridium algidicarnis]|uniref:PadR family transcriptional regulator n=1 Tax=Clostridium algidicarnis TaxID=37659 RepID=UPI001C0B0CE5|nr:PadR family transcriptional regulator [Clostridium algidicarnis]MBU3210298.1 PadR family transcriptional regulator [Clostridium algidicarnis]